MEPLVVVRRAPFSPNPTVGARGQRAQQRILDAALRVFGELGYHRCGVSHITDVAACSRASFYQYFSSKEDVFRHLGLEVARRLAASAEAMGPVGADAAGWDELRDWVERYADIYQRFEPVFRGFTAAAGSDEAVAGSSARIGHRNAATVRATLVRPNLRARRLDAVVELLVRTTSRLPYVIESLRPAVPSHTFRPERVRAALTDVAHRTLFGLDPEVNVQGPSPWPTTRTRLSATLLSELRTVGPPTDLTPTGARTLATLLDAARTVLVAKGWFDTRIDDVTDAAGVSHGAFYRYFDNKEHLVRVLAFEAMRDVSAALDAIPGPDLHPGAGSDGKALRGWLGRYAASNADGTAIIGVWIDATSDDPIGSLESAAALEWGRSRMVRFLRGRSFGGDVEAEGLVLVALVESMGAWAAGPAGIEAAAQVIERGFLGLGSGPRAR